MENHISEESVIFMGRNACFCLAFNQKLLAPKLLNALAGAIHRKDCAVPGCYAPHDARGLCNTHYKRAMSNSSIGTRCSVDGCEKKHAARGYCINHYSKAVRYNRPLESPSDFRGDPFNQDLSEHEFALMKELRQNGFSIPDVCFEIKHTATKVRNAWEFQSYAHYLDREEENPMSDNNAGAPGKQRECKKCGSVGHTPRTCRVLTNPRGRR